MLPKKFKTRASRLVSVEVLEKEGDNLLGILKSFATTPVPPILVARCVRTNRWEGLENHLKTVAEAQKLYGELLAMRRKEVA